MRWDALFADLEAAAEAEERLEHDAEVIEQARAEFAAVRLADRLRAQIGQELTCHLPDGLRLHGEVREVAPQWLFLRTGQGEVLVPATSLLGLEGLGRTVAPPEGEVGCRIGLGVVLRRLAVRRLPVRLILPGGSHVTGTIDRVGADHLDLAVHAADTPRRTGAVRSMRAVPLAALVCVLLLEL